MRGQRRTARPVKRHPTIAACGLDCGLCPRYYTAGKSRCPGCAHGLERFLARQAEQLKLLALLLAQYDDGRSRSFYCRAVSLGDPSAIREAIAQAGRDIAREQIAKDDHRSKARILKALLVRAMATRHAVT